MTENTPTSVLVAIHNAAAALVEDANPVKKFSTKSAAIGRTTDMLANLPKRDYEFRVPGEAKPFRKNSALGVVYFALEQSGGTTLEELGNLLSAFFELKNKPLEEPGLKAKAVLSALHRGRGVGFCRVKDHYWLVPA